MINHASKMLIHASNVLKLTILHFAELVNVYFLWEKKAWQSTIKPNLQWGLGHQQIVPKILKLDHTNSQKHKIDVLVIFKIPLVSFCGSSYDTVMVYRSIGIP